MGRGAGKSATRAKTSTLHQHPIETPSRDRHRHTTRRCAPHRRHGGEEMMKPSTADAPYPERCDNAPGRNLPHPHRRRRHLRPREDESASRVLPSTTCPTETNHRTELSGNKKRSSLRTSKTQKHTYEKYKEPHADNSRQLYASAPPAPKPPLALRFLSALYEPYLELLCLLYCRGFGYSA